MDKQEDGRDTDDGLGGDERTLQGTGPDSAGQSEGAGSATQAPRLPEGSSVRGAFDSFGRPIIGQIPRHDVLVDAVRRRDEIQRILNAVNQEVMSLLQVLCPTEESVSYNLAEGVVVVDNDNRPA